MDEFLFMKSFCAPQSVIDEMTGARAARSGTRMTSGRFVPVNIRNIPLI
jgi:hypothetical protein